MPWFISDKFVCSWISVCPFVLCRCVHVLSLPSNSADTMQVSCFRYLSAVTVQASPGLQGFSPSSFPNQNKFWHYVADTFACCCVSLSYDSCFSYKREKIMAWVTLYCKSTDVIVMCWIDKELDQSNPVMSDWFKPVHSKDPNPIMHYFLFYYNCLPLFSLSFFRWCSRPVADLHGTAYVSLQ